MSDRPKLSWADVMRSVFGQCIDHQPHEQVGRCVYCGQCGRRLYQGQVMTLDELAVIKEATGGQS